MTLIRVCPNCLRSYPDITLNFCTDDGSALSGPLNIPTASEDDETETVIRNQYSRSTKAKPPNSYKKETERLIEAAVRKHRNLAFHVNSGNEHCIEIVGRENRGSLWIRPRPRQNNYRVQTTGQAQQLDRYIEELCGPSLRSAKSQAYQYWHVNPESVEMIIDRFATLP